MSKKRDDELQESIGIYQNLMEDMADLANIFIGNETLDDFNEGGDYEPLLKMVAEFHFNPENARLYTDLKHRINLIKKKVLDLSTQIDSNHKKALFIYRKS